MALYPKTVETALNPSQMGKSRDKKKDVLVNETIEEDLSTKFWPLMWLEHEVPHPQALVLKACLTVDSLWGNWLDRKLLSWTTNETLVN